MGAPKWQEPLARRADRAEQTLRDVVRAPAGGSGPTHAAAAAKRDLAELCQEVAERTASPLLKQLLVNGGQALMVEAGFLEDIASVDDALDELAEDRGEAVPVDEDQALVVPTPEPAETSDDAPANGSAQASLDVDRLAMAQALADAAGGTVVHRGEAYEPVAELQLPAVNGGLVLDVVEKLDDLASQLRSDMYGWLLSDGNPVPPARQCALDGITGVDRCVSLLQELRAELVTSLERADAGGGG